MTGYDAWAAQISNGLTNYSDCATGDGYPNLLKYATGSSPTNSDGLARLSIASTSNGIAARFNRNTNAVDVTLVLEKAEVLTAGTAWVAVATNSLGQWHGSVMPTEDLASTPAKVEFLNPAPSAANTFLRLRVSRP